MTSESDVVDVRVDIKDQGLAVINLLNPELNWQEGKGLVQLRISGSLQQPETGGIKLDLKPEGLFKNSRCRFNSPQFRTIYCRIKWNCCIYWRSHSSKRY